MRELEGRIASLEAARADERGRRDPLGPASGAATPTTTSHAAAPSVPTAAAPPAPPAPSRGVERRDEQPHVTVTIGRVDVRAVFTAPPAAARPPAPRAAQKTTLADYLKQRERGRR